MSRLEQLSRSADSRLRRIENNLAARDAWLSRLMAPARGPRPTASAALASLLGRWRQNRR